MRARPPIASRAGSRSRQRGQTFSACLRDVDGDARANGGAARTLPPFAFDFVQDGERIIPVMRGPIAGPHANWEWIVEPGRAWDEAGDDGFTRAGIPFALQERNENCTHYGALTFLFKSDGTITNAAYQIAGETCAYFNFDLAGLAACLLPTAPRGRCRRGRGRASRRARGPHAHGADRRSWRATGRGPTRRNSARRSKSSATT